MLDARAQAFLRLGNYAEAELAAIGAVQAAPDDDPGLMWTARLDLAQARRSLDPRYGDQYFLEAVEAVKALAESGDDRALAEAWLAKQDASLTRGEIRAALEASEHAIACSERTGSERLVAEARQLALISLVAGPAHVDRVVDFAETEPRPSRRATWRRLPGGRDVRISAGPAGLRGPWRSARSSPIAAARCSRNVGSSSGAHRWRSPAERWRCGPVSSVRPKGRCSAAANSCREAGEQVSLATLAAQLADVLARQGRVQEAEVWLDQARTSADEDDVDARLRWLAAAARTYARGDPDRAAKLAADAVELADATDLSVLRADSWLVRAEVSLAHGRREEAADGAARAEAQYRDKGVILAAAAAAELRKRIPENG